MHRYLDVLQPVRIGVGRIAGAAARLSTRTAVLSAALVAASTVSVWATANTPPSNFTMSVDKPVIHEGESVTLTGSFTDPDAADLHSVVVNWFDGKKEKLQLPAGQLNFSITHTYGNNNRDNYQSKYGPALGIADKDASQGPNDNAPGENHWDQAGATIQVLNVAPTFGHNVSVGRVRGEASKVVITGDVVDPGADIVQVFAHWGQSLPQLGNGPACTLTGKRSYRCEHTYPVPQIGQKSYTVKFTARDDDGDQTSITRTVTLP